MGFDEVFGAVVKDYYLKSFPDYYNEIMGRKIAELEFAVREGLKKN